MQNTPSKKILSIAILSLFFMTFQPLTAADRPPGRGSWGVGLILGEPTGLSLHKWKGSLNAFDAAIAWSFRGDGWLHLHADYLVNRLSNLEGNNGTLRLYFGLGGVARLTDDTSVGIRFPVGVGYYKRDLPLDFFFEVVPVFGIVPETDFWLNGAVGFRVYFK